MADRARARRMAVRIRQLVAEMLERQIKDPRLAMVTVTDARLTADLREATVFYTVYGDDADRASSAAALASATGALRTAVGRSLGVRHTPSLGFVLDALPDNARAIDGLLGEARRADAKVAEVRQGKSPAGDPDPYRETSQRDAAGGGSDL